MTRCKAPVIVSGMTDSMTGPVPLRTKEAVQAALDAAGTIAGASRLLRVSRPTVYDYIKRYGISEWKRSTSAA